MKLRWGTAFLFTALAACSSDEPAATPESSSGDAIVAGQIVAGDSPFYWANIDYAQHRATMEALGSPLSVHDTPDDDVLRVRLQTWADRLDAVMRRVTRNTTAPKPIVNVLRSAQTYNAWSSGTYVRLGAPFGPTNATNVFPVIGFTSPAGDAQEDWTSLGGLLPQPPGWGRLASFTQVWNLAKGPCKLAVQGPRIVLAPGASADCKEQDTNATDIGTVATTPFVTFSSDLVSILPTERALVAVLAHELGHMYRAHSTPLTERKYDFWYDDGAHTAKRPVPSALDKKLREDYKRLVRSEHAIDQVEEASFHVRSRLPILGLAYLGGFDSCAPYATWKSGHDLESLFVQARDGSELFDEARSTYLSFEEVVQSCPRADVFANTPDFGVLDGVVQLPLAAITTSLSSILPSTPFAAPLVGETVLAYLDRLEGRAAADEEEEGAFIAKVRNERIGLYTQEQEADEIALELMTRVGYTEQETLEAWLEIRTGYDQTFGSSYSVYDPGTADAEHCGAWMRDDFHATNAEGQREPIRMSLGSLADSHHGSCYRIYNLYREAKAHRIAPVAPFEPLSPSWDEIKNHAVDLTTEASNGGY